MKKETPLIMKGFLVKQTFAGIKTQTRRLQGLEFFNETPSNWELHHLATCLDGKNKIHAFFKDENGREVLKSAICPYGNIGDLIWIRENFQKTKSHTPIEKYIFQAEYFNTDTKGWKPSIHMPKEASRLWLEIIDIRIERLLSISEADAISEAVESNFSISFQEKRFKNYSSYKNNPSFDFRSAISSFESLFESIHGSASIIHNPFVWVIEFKKVSKSLTV